MNVPTLGELALQARLVDGRRLDEALRFQRQNYLEGDFRRLGELLVDYARCPREAIRRLLQRQGITVVECELCETRYNALHFQGHGTCLRCNRRLHASQPDAPLTVEDTIVGAGGPQAQRLLHEYRQRNPRIGRYEILGEVGRGGMGVIYKAWEANLQRHVALKFLRPYDDVSQEDKHRFRREAQAIAQLRHEHIVQAHAIETTNGLTYMAMDFVAGISLDALTLRGAMATEHVLQVMAQVARALHYAHGRGLLHRDVKPANIVIDRAGKAFLVDFGIAKKTTNETMALTNEGEVLGSLAYMAPEYVAKGARALDHRCDVYGLGVALYESLTRGKLPYGDPDDEDMIVRLVREPPIPVAEQAPGIDPRLAKLIDRAVAKDPAARQPTAEAFAQEVEALLAGRDVRVPQSQEEMEELFVRSAELEPAVQRRVAAAAAAAAPPRSEPEPPAAPAARAGAAAPPPADRRLVVATLALLGFAAALLGAGWAITALRARREVQEWRVKAGQAELKAGMALDLVGDVDGAGRAFDRAVELLPGDRGALEARARLRERRGDAEGAARDRATAAALGGS